MNENNNYNNGNVSPYKASGNLNTIIGNPAVNINSAMDVNIQNVATNKVNVNNSNDLSTASKNMRSSGVNLLGVQNNSSVVTNTPINNTNINHNSDTKVTNIDNTSNNAYSNNNYVTKTYVEKNDKPKKKNIQLKLGAEFKMALLIVVILMIFIFLLPKISEIFRGY